MDLVKTGTCDVAFHHHLSLALALAFTLLRQWKQEADICVSHFCSQVSKRPADVSQAILPRQDGSGPAVAEPVKVPAPAEEAREVVAAGREGADRMNDKGESSEDTGSNGERGSDDESESEFEGFDDMFSGDIALPVRVLSDWEVQSILTSL